MISRQENCKNVKICSSFNIMTPLSNVFEIEFFLAGGGAFWGISFNVFKLSYSKPWKF